ncbi:MAG: hypothetical protein U0793_28900 [Gemmataceae bacterium]
MSPTLKGLFHRRCPVCLEGAIFEHGMRMHKACPVCHTVYEREPGYFLGSLYISYALATVFIGLAMLIVHLAFPDLDLGLAVLIAGVLFLPFVPVVTRYARVAWMYFDRWAWPTRK